MTSTVLGMAAYFSSYVRGNKKIAEFRDFFWYIWICFIPGISGASRYRPPSP